MAHKTLVSGTNYAIKSGKTLVSGTNYAIKSGKTLVAGTNYSIPFSQQYTETPTIPSISGSGGYVKAKLTTHLGIIGYEPGEGGTYTYVSGFRIQYDFILNITLAHDIVDVSSAVITLSLRNVSGATTGFKNYSINASCQATITGARTLQLKIPANTSYGSGNEGSSTEYLELSNLRVTYSGM